MSELAASVVGEGPVVFMVLSEEILELGPRHRFLDFGATFMLVPLLNYYSAEKRGGKKDLVGPVSPNGFKVIFILLIELVAIQVQIAIVKVEKLSLEGPFVRSSSLGPILLQQFDGGRICLH